MIRLNIHEAKRHLSKYLDQLAKGATILLCKRKKSNSGSQLFL
jgi:antitoxin (DNA-binding transcriptional repressor) of toxin-antitoxin stability system